MNLKELEGLTKKGESDRLEFKRSTGQRTQAAKTVCAMLNGLGGFVFFRVTDQGRIVGQEVSTGTLEDIAHEIREIEPPLSRMWKPLCCRREMQSLFCIYPEAAVRTPTKNVPIFETAPQPYRCPERNMTGG